MIASQIAPGEAAKARALRNALQHRFRSLRPTLRELLMHAAAIGRGFDVDVLARVSGRTSAQLRPALRLACAQQLIDSVDGVRERYQFRHALTRDAIYEELVASRLRPLHRRIGLALEKRPATRRPAIEELAFHWWAAGDRARGTRYNETAGDRARAIHAGDEALVHYRRALELLGPHSSARVRIEEKVCAIGAR